MLDAINTKPHCCQFLSVVDCYCGGMPSISRHSSTTLDADAGSVDPPFPMRRFDLCGNAEILGAFHTTPLKRGHDQNIRERRAICGSSVSLVLMLVPGPTSKADASSELRRSSGKTAAIFVRALLAAAPSRTSPRSATQREPRTSASISSSENNKRRKHETRTQNVTKSRFPFDARALLLQCFDVTVEGAKTDAKFRSQLRTSNRKPMTAQNLDQIK